MEKYGPSCEYQFGFIEGCYRNQDEVLCSIISEINERIKRKDSKFTNYILVSFRFFIKNKIIEEEKRIKERSLNNKNFKEKLDDCSKKQIEKLKLAYNFNEISKIKNYFDEKLNSYFETIKNSVKNVESYKENFSLLKIFEITYDFYCIQFSKFEECSKNCLLVQYYKKHSEDLFEDKNFSKYGLISITDEYEILNTVAEPRIYNRNLKITIPLNNVDLDLLKSFKKDKSIKELALKPKYNLYYDGKNEYDISLEALQYGKIFDYNCIGNLIPSKFIDEKSNDCFWVNVNHPNFDITFEEILYDFDIYDNSVVTQVVHLKYLEKNDNYYISHIDHEYVFYTLDEYTVRLNDIKQKGNAKKRQKTFKIDDSEIPFLEDKKPKFLLNILYTYFNNRKLIDEYFNSI